MKRIIVVILCLCILLSGCHKNTKTDNPEDNAITGSDVQTNAGQEISKVPANNTETDNGNDADSTGLQVLKLNSQWSDVTSAQSEVPDLIMPEYEAKTEPYVIADDLSNIENINQFSGFTREQTRFLSDNGFIVLPSSSTRIFYTYDGNVYQGIPNFITTDSVLHMYHQFFDKSLTNIEADFMYQDLNLLTKQMLNNSISLSAALKDEDLKALQDKNISYFLVARMLMAASPEITADIQPGLTVEPKLMDTAKAEYDLISKADSYVESPLFGFDFDYTQFKVRGHYTNSEELGRYFKTLMWFGTAPLEFTDKDGNCIYDNVLQALLVSYTTFLGNDTACNAKLWTDIYQPTAQYVGVSDDIDVFTLNNLRMNVFGSSEDPNIFNDAEYKNKLEAAVKALPEPKIQGELVYKDTPTGKQFRYMGQRYILDSFVMQNLIDSILRPIPSALDVMGVLGSSTAEDLTFNYYRPQDNWPEYTKNYKALKQEVSDYKIDTWGKNLYNGWLWSIKEALTEFGSGMPMFMTNAAYKYKSLNTALGSYTELKHDTILYGKQPVAEAGGDIATADYHYVEPNIPLYSKLLYLTENTIKVLNDKGMMNEKLSEGANSYRDLLKLLITCSVKELRNEKLTEEEYKSLLSYGGMLEDISQSLLEGVSGGSYDTKELTDMLVSDIASCPGQYLTLGTGYFDEIYVVFPVDGKLYLSRGAVYSSYEFVSSERLTDKEWWGLQGIKLVDSDYGEYPEFTEPSKDLPKQPDWVQNFKSEKNDVEITPLEVIWEDMVN